MVQLNGSNVSQTEQPFFALLKVSNRWKVRSLAIYSADTLARFPIDVLAAGHIEEIKIKKQVINVNNLESLKMIWEVTAKVTIFGGYPFRSVGGGRNPDADWQRVLDILEDEDNY